MEPSCWHHPRTVSGEIASTAKELAVFYILNDTMDLRFHRGHGISKVLHLSTPKDAVVHGLAEFCHFGVHLQRGCCRQILKSPMIS